MKVGIIAVGVLASLLGAVRAADTPAHDEYEHEAHASQAPEARTVVVPEAVQRAMGLVTVRPEKRRLAAAQTFYGRFELAPEARYTVASPVAGRVTFVASLFAPIAPGEVLFTVASPELSARAQEIDVLEKRLAVYNRLQTANAALASELAVKRASRAALLAGACESNGVVVVRAPAAGRLEGRDVAEGAWVEAGAAVATCVDPARVRFTAALAAGDAAHLRDGQSVTVGGATGRLVRATAAEGAQVRVHVLFAQPVDARAGDRAEAVCAAEGSAALVWAVPARSIVTIGLAPHVFLRDAHDAGEFIAVPVTPGATAGGWTELVGWTPPAGAEIVAAGAYELKLALPAPGTTASPGHYHADGAFHADDDHD